MTDFISTFLHTKPCRKFDLSRNADSCCQQGTTEYNRTLPIYITTFNLRFVAITISFMENLNVHILLNFIGFLSIMCYVFSQFAILPLVRNVLEIYLI